MPAQSDCDDDIDIYADIGSPQEEESLRTLQSENKLLKEEVSSLKAQLHSLQSRIATLREANKNLCCNISVLFKTAKAENERKDGLISELRRELDNLIFKRNKNTSKSTRYHDEAACSRSYNEESSLQNLEDTIRRKASLTSTSQKSTNKGIFSTFEKPRTESSELYNKISDKVHLKDKQNKDLYDVSQSDKAATKTDIQRNLRAESGIRNEDPLLKSHKKNVSGSADDEKKRKISGADTSKKDDSSMRNKEAASKAHTPIVSRSTHDTKKKSSRAGDLKKEDASIKDKVSLHKPQKATVSGSALEIKKKSSNVSDFKKEELNVADRIASSKSRKAVVSQSVVDEPKKKISNDRILERERKSVAVKSSVKSWLHDADTKSTDLPKNLRSAIKEDNLTQNTAEVETQSQFVVQCNEVSSICNNVESSPDSNKENTIGGDRFKLSVELSVGEEKVPSKSSCTKETVSVRCWEKVVDQSNSKSSNVTVINGLSYTPESKTDALEPSVSQEGTASIFQLSTGKLTFTHVSNTDDNMRQDHSISLIAVELVTNPPLPEEDPAPLPPLPYGSPPVSPVKHNVQSLSNLCPTEADESVNIDRRAHSLDSIQKSINASPGTKKEDAADDSTLEPHLQFPFKPRRRVKSMMVINAVDVTKENEARVKASISDESKPRLPCGAKSYYSTPSVIYNRTGRKDEGFDNRYSFDSRPVSRPSHNSRHLPSVKWAAHTPERRSPSEVLNSKSCRIERISHQDEIRIRIRDRRSRSLSPFRRYDKYEKCKRDDYHSRPRDTKRVNPLHNFSRDDQQQNRIDSRRINFRKSPEICSDRRLTRSRAKLKSEVARSTPADTETKSDKKLNFKLGSNCVRSKGDTEMKEGLMKPEKPSHSIVSVTKPNTVTGVQSTSDSALPTLIVLKRKSGTVLRLEDSEAATYNNCSKSCSQSMSLKSNGLQENEASHAAKRLCLGASSTSHPIGAGQIVNSRTAGRSSHSGIINSDVGLQGKRRKTPLYFREQNYSCEQLKASSGEESFSESEDSSSSAGSDISYKPSYHRKRIRKKDTKQNSRKKSVLKH